MYFDDKQPCKEFRLREPVKPEEIRTRLGLPSLNEVAKKLGGLYQPMCFYDVTEGDIVIYGKYTSRDTIAVAVNQPSAIECVAQFADFIGDCEA